MYTKVKAKKIVYKALSQMWVDSEIFTDPKIIQETLHDMQLHDFTTSHDALSQLLEDAKKVPQNINFMIENSIEGIIKNSIFIEVLELGVEKWWFQENNYIQRSLHTFYILEILVITSVNNVCVLEELRNHILQKRSEFGIYNKSTFLTFLKLWKLSGDIFTATKVVSIDPGIEIHLHRAKLWVEEFDKNYLKQLYWDWNLTYAQYRILQYAGKWNGKYKNIGLDTNIYEAGVTEFQNGFISNATTAYILSEFIKVRPFSNLIQQKSSIPKMWNKAFYDNLSNSTNYLPTFNLPQDWIDIYSSWNMNFVFTKLDNPHILLPKLLLPSVINADHKDYMPIRIVALWLSANTMIFRKMLWISDFSWPKNTAPISKLWWKINQRYAYKFYRKHAMWKLSDIKNKVSKNFQYKVYNVSKRIFYTMYPWK